MDHEQPAWRCALTAPLAASAGALVLLVAVLLVAEPALVPAVLVPAALGLVLGGRLQPGAGLQISQMERLRRAEVALAAAGSTQAAAREMADHALALLGAPSASVLIEGIGDTVRVTRGDPTGSVYGDGSRMRLLEVDGVPCGSIAVSARADGKPYSRQQERMLDTLAERVSSTLHRLALFTRVDAEQRTLADILQSSSDGIFTVGIDLHVDSWNPAMARILGVPAEQAIGSPISAVFRPVAEDGTPRHGQADPGRSGRAEEALVSVETAVGEQRWLTCSWAPLSEGGYVVVARDDTERKNLQDDKDGWIAQVSHELRTPLTPIKGFLQTLQRRDEQFDTAERQRIYEVMLHEEQRLEDLVTSLLQATSLDRGAVASPEVLDWPALVEEQIDQQRRSDPSRTITFELEPGEHRTVADPSLARSVVANLLSNAVKYSPPGSPVEVEVRVDGGRSLTVVTDHGDGVAPSDRERIFEKFTRLGDHLTRPQQGVGLGLYIARRSVDQMGGRIWCSEAPHGGARFGFTLPLHTAAVPADPVASVRSARKPRRARPRAKAG